MAPKHEKNSYDELLDQARELSRDGDVPAEGSFSLEEILAEYGESREQKLLKDVEQAAAPAAEAAEERKPEAARPRQEPEDEPTVALPDLAGKAPERPRRQEPAGEPARQRKPTPAQPAEADPLAAALPRPPRPVSMEEVVGRTVDAVMEEHTPPAEKPRRRGLFSRKPMADTEELYREPEPEEAPPALEEEEEEEAEAPIGPEVPLEEAATDARRLEKHWRKFLPGAALLTAALAAVMTADSRGVAVPLWTGDLRLQTLVQLAVLTAVCLLCGGVFTEGFSLAARKRCSAELLAAVSALITGGDCLSRLVLSGRSDAAPYALTACAALTFAQWGLVCRERGMFDAYRAAAIGGEPPYLVTNVPQGACKQRGCTQGFYTDTVQDDLSLIWQTALLPIVLVGSLVFAGLSSLGQGRGADFLLCWSAILSASSSLALPLAWSLPWSRLAARLQKSGCAVAGWAGAAAISRKRAMILTDLDLFPPGSVYLNGVKMYGEELSHAASYAASLVRASGSGLERVFDDLVRSEGGRYYELDDFSFYEEGGCSANIRGESVLLGTASFMRKMDVRLPGNLNLHTGLYLAVDRQLSAVFAVKYDGAENVDWALRMLRRNRISPILASRDPNITPALVKRKFGKGVRVEYPALAARLALSEQEEGRGRPRALLLREGLLPYAETVVGSRRLRCSVRNGTLLSMLGSVSGTLLAFYFCFQGGFALMPPVALLVFLLLWVVPVLLLTDWTGRL